MLPRTFLDVFFFMHVCIHFIVRLLNSGIAKSLMIEMCWISSLYFFNLLFVLLCPASCPGGLMSVNSIPWAPLSSVFHGVQLMGNTRRKSEGWRRESSGVYFSNSLPLSTGWQRLLPSGENPSSYSSNRSWRLLPGADNPFSLATWTLSIMMASPSR